ncbi:hypothetical protein SAMN05192561_11212 [Halopenitus malekzadehii]|uniref:Major capsid protein n=1 Tax=Halopenitus malekzadehii TaxID=1267564 RepID=A0A1H6JF80_9EURY|nr:hypothetical protein [Halopenitus malekzadehii]SEH60540.1 hypothetical protein SAMN05192561_11212 [Halopenitus malekzadehii]
MPELEFKKAGLLSPKTLREEIVQDIDQMEQMQEDGVADANGLFPAVNLDAPEESYFTIGGAIAAMSEVDRAAESPISALGDINEKDISTYSFKEKIAPEKETDAKLNSDQQILSLYRWGANQLRAALFLTRNKVAFQATRSVDGFLGTDGDTIHPDIPTANVINPNNQYSDRANSTPYENFSYASYLLSEADQTYMNAMVSGDPTALVTPSIWHDIKNNEDMKGRFSGVEVRGLTGSQVRRLVDEEIPNIQVVKVKLPREDANGNFLDEDGNIVNDVDDAAMDNVLEPYDPVAGEQRRNIIIGRPGVESAFLAWYGDNMGEFDEPDAPSTDGGFAVDNDRGFGTQTWMSQDPRVTWLKAFQDIGFHIMLPEHWVIINDV